MLSREQWSIPKIRPVQPGVVSLENLITWLECQPAHERYDPCSLLDCPLGQFLAAVGCKDIHRVSLRLGSKGVFSEIALAEKGERTFGAALARARLAFRSM